ncbi:hypothetical protein BC938DRAFT_482193, partial [Jimgerdemannia flammicorona]
MPCCRHCFGGRQHREHDRVNDAIATDMRRHGRGAWLGFASDPGANAEPQHHRTRRKM